MSRGALPQPAPPRGAAFSEWTIAGGLLLAVLVAYWPAFQGALLWNDPDYVTKPALQSAHGLWRIWFELGATEQYYPVLHSAFWLEHRIWDDAAPGYHLVNALLHATAAWLLTLVLRRLAVRGAVLAGFIFAVHPVCVESVAWISEQKNTLSTALYLGSALVYLGWRGDSFRKEAGAPGPGRYALATGLFILALLSKSVVATLPAALLVVAWWRWGRLSWRSDVLPLLPWLALGAGFGLFSAWVERVYIGAQGTLFGLNFPERCVLAGRAVWFYAGKLVWPASLSFIYPRWTVSVAGWQRLFPLGVLATALAFWSLRRRSRAPLAVLLFFVGSLFPTLGFFNVYAFVFSYVADHWQYLPAVGVIAAASAAWGEWRSVRRADSRPALLLAGAVVAVLAALTWRQTWTYRDVETLYRSTLERNPRAWLAHNNLGDLELKRGQVGEAVAEYEAALKLAPWYPEIHYNLANALALSGKEERALAEYREAIRLHPGYSEAEANLGTLLIQLRRFPEAEAVYEEALRGRPGEAGLHTGLGIALSEMDRPVAAAGELEQALRLDPGVIHAHYWLGNILANQGRLAEAIVHYRAEVRLRPDYAEAQANLGLALATVGRQDEAVAALAAAVRLKPTYSEAHGYLGFALAKSGRLDDAVREYREALRLHPDFPTVHYQLGLTLRILGRTAEAEREFQLAGGR